MTAAGFAAALYHLSQAHVDRGTAITPTPDFVHFLSHSAIGVHA
jgi:hypothetical protein